MVRFDRTCRVGKSRPSVLPDTQHLTRFAHAFRTRVGTAREDFSRAATLERPAFNPASAPSKAPRSSPCSYLCVTTTSIQISPRLNHHVRPMGRILADRCGKFVGAAACRLSAGRAKALLEGREPD